MYFPYLRVKNEEVEALITSICNDAVNNVIPILEPISEIEDDLYNYQALTKVATKLVENKKKFILKVGQSSDIESLRTAIKGLDDFLIQGYSVTTHSEIKDAPNYALIYDMIPSGNISDNDNIIYHVFLPDTNRFSSIIDSLPLGKVVVIEDGFKSYNTNAEFPVKDLFNSELVFNYDLKGYAGFGDYTILPRDFIPQGGANPNTITHVIHLTRNENNILFVYHFLTTPYEKAVISERSNNTLVLADRNSHLFYDSNGIRLIKDKLRAYSTSLGIYKRIGIIHHIELISNILLNKTRK